MATGIRIIVDESKRGLTIRWLEAGLERHVWVDQQTFEQFLASGRTTYVDTPAVATQGPARPHGPASDSGRHHDGRRSRFAGSASSPATMVKGL